MTQEEILTFTRNHASEVRAILLHQDTEINALVEGYVVLCEHTIGSLQDALDLAIDKIELMKDALDGLE